MPPSFRLSHLLCIFTLVSCQGQKPEYEDRAEIFIRTYYLQSNPKGALEFSEGAANDKLQKELSLLEGFSASHESERPRMHYKILGCETDEPNKAQCNYQLDIQMDRLRVRRGRLTLRKSGKAWRVTQFVEEPYQDD